LRLGGRFSRNIVGFWVGGFAIGVSRTRAAVSERTVGVSLWLNLGPVKLRASVEWR
jgi:hypothetical protein